MAEEEYDWMLVKDTGSEKRMEHSLLTSLLLIIETENQTKYQIN